MQVTELSIAGVFVFEPQSFGDNRGVFAAPFQGEVFHQTVGHPMRLGQTNHSVSRRGTIRGVHFADTPPGQSKYIYCPRGSMLDVIVDIRVGSPTFGQWDSVLLDDEDRRAIYLPEGVGHAFMALEDHTVVNYLCSAPYAPDREHAIHPLDPALGITWPTKARDGSPISPLLSPKDDAAPTLAEVRERDLLPSWEDCQSFMRAL
jgi:epimerase EvaD